jgi:hypothetical protein
MTNPVDRNIKRHIREEATVNQAAEGVRKRSPDAEPTEQSPMTSSGQSVEGQVRKEWNSKRKGGLPVFCR